MPHTVEPGMTRRNLTTVDGSRRERVKGYCAVAPVTNQRQAPNRRRSGSATDQVDGPGRLYELSLGQANGVMLS